jgi:hypothetical protein
MVDRALVEYQILAAELATKALSLIDFEADGFRD